MIFSFRAIAVSATAAPPYSHPTTTAIFLHPSGCSSLPAAQRFLNRSRSYGVRRLKRFRNQGGRRAKSVCRAELAHDAPFAAAIVACVITSLASPIRPTAAEDEDGGGAMDSTDARLAVMGIIGFIPYFNWLSWVFAWLDTGSPRYLVYSIVYLTPYLRTNLSISPEESWLPIASILICIIHIQLEASIRNGDLEGFDFFKQALNLVSPFNRKEDPSFKSFEKSSQGRSKENVGLPPSTQEQRERFREWGNSTKQIEGVHQNEGSDEIREKNSD